MKKRKIILIAVTVLVLMVPACGLGSEPVLNVSGVVQAEFSQKTLEAFDQTNSEIINKEVDVELMIDYARSMDNKELVKRVETLNKYFEK